MRSRGLFQYSRIIGISSVESGYTDTTDGFCSRENAEQSRIVDEVYAVIARHGIVRDRSGVLSAETKLEARDILAALELLLDEGKIVRTAAPKDEPPPFRLP